MRRRKNASNSASALDLQDWLQHFHETFLNRSPSRTLSRVARPARLQCVPKYLRKYLVPIRNLLAPALVPLFQEGCTDLTHGSSSSALSWTSIKVLTTRRPYNHVRYSNRDLETLVTLMGNCRSASKRIIVDVTVGCSDGLKQPEEVLIMGSG